MVMEKFMGYLKIQIQKITLWFFMIDILKNILKNTVEIVLINIQKTMQCTDGVNHDK